MRRVYLIASLAASTVLVALLVPAAALAGMYTWNMPASFTTAAPGSNPDHDNYGGTPWRYVEGPSILVVSPSLTPSSVSKLPNFSTTIAGGLSGWTDSGDANAFVADNTTATAQGSIPAGQLGLNPASDRVVALEWTSPLSQSATLTITGSVTAEGSCPSWSLNHGNTPIQSGSGSAAISPTTAPTVAPGDTISLVVGYSGMPLQYDGTCAALAVSLQITASGASPTITLDSPGNTPLLTPTPTLTGTAGHAIGDSNQVTLVIYPGSSTTGSPVRMVTGSRDSNGHFSIQVTPALEDGQYTAVARQAGVISTGTSNPRTFRIKVHPPAVTLTQPASGANVKSQAPLFAGAAGDALGDSSQVTVVLYSGGSAKGKPVGTLKAARLGARWSGVWPRALKLGRYTAKAMQTDDAGHTGVTVSRTFRIVRGPTAIGKTVRLSRHGNPKATVSVTCHAPVGQTCAGDVLILTTSRYRPVRSGPSGQLRVMFAYVIIPAGKTLAVTRPVSGVVARMLRRSAPLNVSVEASLSVAGGLPARYSAVRTLRLR